MENIKATHRTYYKEVLPKEEEVTIIAFMPGLHSNDDYSSAIYVKGDGSLDEDIVTNFSILGRLD